MQVTRCKPWKAVNYGPHCQPINAQNTDHEKNLVLQNKSIYWPIPNIIYMNSVYIQIHLP